MNLEWLDLQHDVVEKLNNAKKNGRLSHAYIFDGESGVGKNLVAHYFALLLYSEGDVDLNSNLAHQIFNDEFLNVFTVYSDSKVIKKNQITDLQAEFSKTGQIEGARIYVINDAEKMNLSSQNSLLKFIEEPANNTYGILLTTNKDLILPTIRSRCQLMTFKSLDYDFLKKTYIKEGIDKKYANFIAYLTNDIDEAKRIYQDEDMKRLFDTFISFMYIKSKREFMIYSSKHKEFLTRDNILSYYIKLLTLFYEDVLFLYNKRLRLNFADYTERVQIFKNNYSINEIEDKLDLLTKLQKIISSSNVLTKNIYLSLITNLM